MRPKRSPARAHDPREGLRPQHPKVAQTLNNLGVLHANQGRFEAAEPLYKRALEIREASYGPDHLTAAETRKNGATLYYAQGRYDEAAPLYQQALKVRRRPALSHPSLATTLSNLAELDRIEGRIDDGMWLHRRALRSARGPRARPFRDRPEREQCGRRLFRQGGLRDARTVQAQLLIKEAALGPDHPELALTLSNLAELYRTQRRLAEAEPLYTRALPIDEKALAPTTRSWRSAWTTWRCCSTIEASTSRPSRCCAGRWRSRRKRTVRMTRR